jgi:hypothetical protein
VADLVRERVGERPRRMAKGTRRMGGHSRVEDVGAVRSRLAVPNVVAGATFLAVMAASRMWISRWTASSGVAVAASPSVHSSSRQFVHTRGPRGSAHPRARWKTPSGGR